VHLPGAGPVRCSTGRNVGDTQEIQLAPDGKHAYAGQYDKGISVFDRNPSTGLLTQKSGTAGCISEDGNDDTGAGTCAIGRLSRGTFALLVTPNGKWLYNMDSALGFSTFQINSDGSLIQLAERTAARRSTVRTTPARAPVRSVAPSTIRTAV
jgi:hypothetical protein